MLVKPLVIDLGWGTLKSALVNLKDSDFVKPHDAVAQRQTLLKQYVAAFRHVESANHTEARTTLKSLGANISSAVVPDRQRSLSELLDGQLAKLA